jgi:hypothetical protein
VQGRFALVALSSLLLTIDGCGDSHSNPVNGVRQGLQVSPDATVTLANYTVTGPDDFASAGTVVVGESPDLSVVLSNLPVGQAYVLDLTATASDGVIVCDGSTTFDVTQSNATLTLIVHLMCAVPSGDVNLQSTVNICPVLDGLSASPVILNLGGVSSLVVAAHDSDSGPSALAYSWAINGIKLPNRTTPTLSFVCSSVGSVTIAATVSDGDPDPTCVDSSSLEVRCE